MRTFYCVATTIRDNGLTDVVAEIFETEKKYEEWKIQNGNDD